MRSCSHPIRQPWHSRPGHENTRAICPCHPAPPATVSLLAPKPIKETEFIDASNGSKSRRYCVVVDALGQRGIPLHPVWGFRPWRDHYVPRPRKTERHQ